MNNLALLKSNLKIIDQYRQYLYDWCKSTNDISFLKKIVLPTTSKISSSSLFDKPY